MNNISIHILSCEAFSDMWENDLYLYNKYWKDHPVINIISDSNSQKLFEKDVMCIKGEMSTRLLKSLDCVSTKYVFLTFDDYYPCKEINTSKINKLIEEMENKNIDYCRLFDKPRMKGPKNKELGYYNLPLKEIYEVNFYPSIWKVDTLRKVLKENETIWKAEARITRRARENNLKGIALSYKGTFDFIDIVRKGKYLRSGYRFIKKNNLFLSDRPIRSIRETITLNIRTFISEHIPLSIKNALKKYMNKKGKIYYSDYENTDD